MSEVASIEQRRELVAAHIASGETRYQEHNEKMLKAFVGGTLIVASVETEMAEHRGSDYSEFYPAWNFAGMVRGSNEPTVFRTTTKAVADAVAGFEVSYPKSYYGTEFIACQMTDADDDEYADAMVEKTEREEAARKVWEFARSLRDRVIDAVELQGLVFITAGRKVPHGIYHNHREFPTQWGRVMNLMEVNQETGNRDEKTMHKFISTDNRTDIVEILREVPVTAEGSSLAGLLENLTEKPASVQTWVCLIDEILENNGMRENAATTAIRAFTGFKLKAKRVKKAKA